MTRRDVDSWCWWSQPGSNRRPSGCKPDALPAELWPLANLGCAARCRRCRAAADMVGLGGVEPPTSPLSGVRSNQLSYRPGGQRRLCPTGLGDKPTKRLEQVTCDGGSRQALLGAVSLKEVIQPHVPVRLPCYDFTPVIEHTVVGAPLAVRLPASGAINSHGVTGGVYKTRERIHRSNADLRLLAIPTSRSRVADSDPDYDRLYGIGSTLRLSDPLYLPL